MQNSVLNITVSGFQNVKATTPQAVNLLTWLTSDKWRQQVEKVRQASTKEERTLLKQAIPAITPSGTFTERNQAGLVQHSGLLCLDIDKQDNGHLENFGELKHHLSKIENFAYVGLSVSGAGYFCLVPITMPERHKDHFQALQTDLERFGIIIDKSGSDITRLRFYSFDSEAYFNHNAKPYSRLESIKSIKNIKSINVSNDSFNQLLNKISSSATDITGNYSSWFEIGAGLANEFGETGRQYFHEISRFSPKYKASYTDKQFTQCLRHRYRFTISTFYHYAKQAGITLEERQNIKNIESIKSINVSNDLVQAIKQQWQSLKPEHWFFDFKKFPLMTRYNLDLLAEMLKVTPEIYLEAYEKAFGSHQTNQRLLNSRTLQR